MASVGEPVICSQRDTSFLDLPPELRTSIYNHALIPQHRQLDWKPTGASTSVANFLIASRQIYHEAIPILLGSNELQIDGGRSFLDFLLLQSATQLGYIRHLKYRTAGTDFADIVHLGEKDEQKYGAFKRYFFKVPTTCIDPLHCLDLLPNLARCDLMIEGLVFDYKAELDLVLLRDGRHSVNTVSAMCSGVKRRVRNLGYDLDLCPQVRMSIEKESNVRLRVCCMPQRCEGKQCWYYETEVHIER